MLGIALELSLWLSDLRKRIESKPRLYRAKKGATVSHPDYAPPRPKNFSQFLLSISRELRHKEQYLLRVRVHHHARTLFLYSCLYAAACIHNAARRWTYTFLYRANADSETIEPTPKNLFFFFRACSYYSFPRKHHLKHLESRRAPLSKKKNAEVH